ncbi:pisatin demethylase [Massariosphaeria phaeospora]|uniref:Pisatin demethylase n=1 Tax=Massariosphaeria phaeospora TaxID=100035 RepID=A0A7C8I4G9_9PLEO|nr:pisatin demethylase [Massariosphaeria phaeospora]
MALLEYLSVPSPVTILWLFVAYWAGWVVYCRTLHPLASVPGPLWPAVSRTWQMYRIYVGDLEIKNRELHNKFGPLVRIGPNEVSSSDPAAIPLIYRDRNPLAKSDYYSAFSLKGISHQKDLFTDTDEVHHAKYRKIVAPAYTMSSVLKSEDAIDECTVLFIQRLREFAAKKQSIDFGLWLEMYGYDIIGRLLYGRNFGFLEKSTDVGSYIESLDKALPLLTVSAVGPSYMRTLVMVAALFIPGTLKALNAVGGLQKEAREIAQQRGKEPVEDNLKKKDILSQYFRIINEKGADVDFSENEVVLECWVGIVAGADSVAITMRSVFYYLMKHPEAHAKVVAEIKEADYAGRLSSPIKYSETMSHLPYTCACIREASRIFPSFAIHMSRVAPQEGLALSGYHIANGYRVAMSAAVVQRDTSVFGLDADQFKPERWLESEERNFAMEKGMLHFGAGTRTCTGKPIALIEMHKLIPEVLRHFCIEMAHNRPWKTRNAGFVKQKDIIVNLTTRA